MKDLKPTCRIAVVQAAPVLFDKTACTDKAVRLIAECAQHGAELNVFPELFIPGYPYGMTFLKNSIGSASWSRVTLRMFVRSILTTRSSVRRLHAS